MILYVYEIPVLICIVGITIGGPWLHCEYWKCIQ